MNEYCEILLGCLLKFYDDFPDMAGADGVIILAPVSLIRLAFPSNLDAHILGVRILGVPVISGFAPNDVVVYHINCTLSLGGIHRRRFFSIFKIQENEIQSNI